MRVQFFAGISVSLLLPFACTVFTIYQVPREPTAVLSSEAAGNGVRTFDNGSVKMDYPGTWRTVEEIFGFSSGQTHDKELDAESLITVTNDIPSPFGEKYTAWCELFVKQNSNGVKISELIADSYEILRNYENSEISIEDTTWGGFPAIVKVYRRPRGEPWYQVRDIWVNKADVIYILSCYEYPKSYDSYESIFKEIQDSVVFK
jgi:hypothetical protein